MYANVIAAVLTVLINIAIGIGTFFFMLIAMNGFSEGDAEKGLIAYIILALTVTALMAIGAFLSMRIMMKKGIGPIVSALIVVPVFSLAGGGLKVVCAFIGIAIAEYVRVNY